MICSWPPAGNPFEQAGFRTRRVQLYVAINSGLELDAVVHLFRREARA